MSKALVASFIASVAIIGGALTFIHREPVAACEELIKATLLSPGSYERVSVERPYAAPGMVEIEITYDAKNAFGTPLRQEWRCTYQRAGARADTSFAVNSGPTAEQRMNDVLADIRGSNNPLNATPGS